MSDAAEKTIGLYIHIPFCVKKCRYCGFNSFEGKDADVRRGYADKLMTELSGRSRAFRNEYTVNSIFIGGGTPSILDTDCIEELMDGIYSLFRVAPDSENTIEANPGTVSRSKLKNYLRAGINRLSLGVQSFDDEKLAYLGRIHSAAEAEKGFRAAREAGFRNINIDMMFGVPGEDLKKWKADIRRAVGLDPDHVSFYSLQVEEGTAVREDIMTGRVEPVDEVEDRLMYHHAIGELAASGYIHYEISNAAKEGFFSRHNLKYWSIQDYLGLGLGAHSYVGGVRFANTEDWSEYMTAVDYRLMTALTHRNDKREDISEYVFLGLRKIEGIDLKSFKNRFGKDFWDIYSHETEELIGRGLLVLEDGNLRLTPLGLDLSDRVFMEYV